MMINLSSSFFLGCQIIVFIGSDEFLCSFWTDKKKTALLEEFFEKNYKEKFAAVLEDFSSVMLGNLKFKQKSFDKLSF